MCLFQYGLYGSFLGCFLYIFFGSCKDVPIGPTAIVSLLTFQIVANLENPESHAILLCLLAGVIELLMGIFGLGKYLFFFCSIIFNFCSQSRLICRFTLEVS